MQQPTFTPNAEAKAGSGISFTRIARLFLIIVGLLALLAAAFNGWDWVQHAHGALSCEMQYSHLLTSSPGNYETSVSICHHLVAETLMYAEVSLGVGIFMLVVSGFVGRKR